MVVERICNFIKIHILFINDHTIIIVIITQVFFLIFTIYLFYSFSLLLCIYMRYMEKAMALCDMFTVLFPAPGLVYMFTFGNHYKPLAPIPACYAWNAFNEVRMK